MAETMFVVMLYSVLALLFTGICIGRRAWFYGVIGMTFSLWELGTVFSLGSAVNIILSTTYDPNTVSYHDYTIAPSNVVILLTLITVVAAVAVVDAVWPDKREG